VSLKQRRRRGGSVPVGGGHAGGRGARAVHRESVLGVRRRAGGPKGGPHRWEAELSGADSSGRSLPHAYARRAPGSARGRPPARAPAVRTTRAHAPEPHLPTPARSLSAAPSLSRSRRLKPRPTPARLLPAPPARRLQRQRPWPCRSGPTPDRPCACALRLELSRRREEGKEHLDRDAACGERKAAHQIKKNRGEGVEGVAARGIFAAGGGKGGWNSGGLQSSETKQRQRSKRKGVSQGLVCNFRELQGPPGKEEFNHCSRAQTKM
jgi:hypothetical protein